MKSLLIAIAILSSFLCAGQLVPQHYADHHINGMALPQKGLAFGADSGIVQCLYRPADFTGNPPYGKIKNVYLRTSMGSVSGGWKNCKYYNLNFSLGYTNLVNMDTVSKLISNVTLVAKADTFMLDTVLGGWIKAPVNKTEGGPFYFDPSQNLVLAIHLDSGSFYKPCPLLQSAHFIPDPIFYQIWGTKSGHAALSKDYYFLDFGFDLDFGADVDELSKLANASVYPNPNSGRFTISFDAKREINELTATIINVTGQHVWSERFQQISSRFSTELDLSNIAKGMYFIELKADGEKLTRKLVVQ